MLSGVALKNGFTVVNVRTSHAFVNQENPHFSLRFSLVMTRRIPIPHYERIDNVACIRSRSVSALVKSVGEPVKGMGMDGARAALALYSRGRPALALGFAPSVGWQVDADRVAGFHHDQRIFVGEYTGQFGDRRVVADNRDAREGVR